jgi:hypothetical protein
MALNPKFQQLHDAGVSIWLDTLSCDELQSSRYRRRGDRAAL